MTWDPPALTRAEPLMMQLLTTGGVRGCVVRRLSNPTVQLIGA